MPKLISINKFAKLVGVSQPYISKMISSGKLPGGKDGIDLENEMILRYIRAKKEEKDEANESSGKANGKKSGKAKKGTRDRWELERVKLEAQIERMELENGIRRGEFLSREVVREFLNKLFAIENNELARLGDRLAPELAGMMGITDPKKITKINLAIETDVTKGLERIGKHFQSYLAKIKTEG